MVLVRPPDAAALAPFGAVIDPPEAPGQRRMFSDWFTPVAGLSLQVHVNHVAPAALPLSLSQVEHHPHSAQAFVPMDVSRYLVTVMPRDARGAPDPSRALGFLMPGDRGIVYRAGAWHAGITVLDRRGHFAVLMLRGAADDDVFAPIPAIGVDLPPAPSGTDP
jgi:ureidoglycolate lyase